MKKTLLTLLMIANLAQADFSTEAKYAYMIDYQTGTVLYNKRGNEKMVPASMSKLMTAYILFEKLQSGELSPDDKFTVSVNAWRKGGAKSGSSTMFLEPKQKVKIKDLLRGIIVQSGNDACIVAAENISGSEENFALLMNEKAKKLGLKNSSFKNATGIPEKGHEMTAEDLAILAKHLIADFPEYYSIYSEKSFTYNKIKQGNRNPLLYANPKADGLKTGHTSVSGFGLVASAENPDKKSHRVILVINGLKTMKARGTEAKRFLTWGLQHFDNYTFLEKGQVVAEMPIWLGREETVNAIMPETITLSLPKTDRKDIKVTFNYQTPLKAPIEKGTQIGELVFTNGDKQIGTYPVIAEKSVEKVGYIGKVKFALKKIFSFLY